MPVSARFDVMRDHQVQFPRASMTNGWRHASLWQPKPDAEISARCLTYRKLVFPLSSATAAGGPLVARPGGPLSQHQPGGWRVVPSQPGAFSRTSGTVDVRLDDTSIMRASGLADRRTDGTERDGWTSEPVDIVAWPDRTVCQGGCRRGATTHPAEATYIIDVASVDDDCFCRSPARPTRAYFVTNAGRRRVWSAASRRVATDPRTGPCTTAGRCPGRDPDRFKTATCWRRCPRDEERARERARETGHGEERTTTRMFSVGRV